MAEETIETTPDNTDAGTSQEATQGDEQQTDAATQVPNQEDEDKKNLVRQRDANFQGKKEAEDRLAMLETTVYKNAVIDGLAKKYPDVPRDVLEIAESPEAAEAIALKFQQLGEKKKQEALAELQTVGQPKAIPRKDAQAKLAELKDSGDLEGAINIKMNMER